MGKSSDYNYNYGDDGYATILSDRTYKAKKAHICTECRRSVHPGERYRCEAYIFDGEMHVSKMCEHCQIARSWLMDNTGGFAYNCIVNDICDHYYDGDEHSLLGRLTNGIQNKWIENGFMMDPRSLSIS